MDLNSLQVFIQVAELNSFTRAGEKLGYSQPTVSFQIKQLEQELGVQLFDRIGHSISLTDAGHDALAYAQEICRLSQEMTLNTSRRYEPEGKVRLALADSLCAPLIAAGYAAFRAAYPKVSVHLTSAGTGEMFRLLDHNEADIVCTLDRHIYDTAYVIAAEEEIGVHVVAATDHPLAKRKQVSIHELLNEPFLLTEKGMSYRRLMDERLAQTSIQIQPVLEIGRADLICELVEQGLGLSFLPDYVTEDAVRRGSIVRLNVPGFEPELWKQLLHHRGHIYYRGHRPLQQILRSWHNLQIRIRRSLRREVPRQ